MKKQLTREQCLEILRAPRGPSLMHFAKKFDVSIEFIKYVRYHCKFLLKKKK